MNSTALKKHLAAIFDDYLHTRKWHNIVDYLIIAMIVISTVEVFLSTFHLNPRLRHLLFWVDIVTLVFFTIEVTLRIWVAPEINPAYRGWKGRLKYCFSFHGFVDVISTYPYYLQWLVPFPIGWLKVLRMSRTMRLFRMSRYMKSWRLLTDTIHEKRRELIISMQFLVVVTFILSLLLFFFEHDAQPDVYENGFSTVAWSFAQYIGDPGGFGDTPPITIMGKIIACVVGLLGIAIVAVPAGILGAGFTEAIEQENNKEKLSADLIKLRNGFERKLDRPSGFQVVPPYRTFTHLQARYGMTQEDIISAVNDSKEFRLVNLADTRTLDTNPVDTLAVEHFSANRPYGLCIDRKSPFTVIAPAAFVDPCSGFFAYYIALIGGFNYISREFGVKAPYRSFYIIPEDEQEQGEEEYFNDLKSLLEKSEGSVTILASSGANEPEYDTQIHIGTGNPRGNEQIGDFVANKEAFSQFYESLRTDLSNQFGIEVDTGKYHTYSQPIHFLRKMKMERKGFHFIMRVAWSAMLWNPQRILIAKIVAQDINRYLFHQDTPLSGNLYEKKFGF